MKIVRSLFGKCFVALCIVAVSGAFLSGNVRGEARTVRVGVDASSEAESYDAYRTLDGNPDTFWHTEFQGASPKHPHELRVDLKGNYTITGFRILNRKDMWNGSIAQAEIFFSTKPEKGEPVLRVELKKTHDIQSVLFSEPLEGRYFTIRALNEVDGQPWASIAELEILCEGVTFRAAAQTELAMLAEALGDEFDPEDELVRQYTLLLRDLKNRRKFEEIAPEVFREEASILASDRDPLDIVLRRTRAALEDMRSTNEDAAANFDVVTKKLQTLQDRAAEVPVDSRRERFELYLQSCKVRREILFSHPLLDFEEIVFLKKHRGTYSHMCDQYYGINLLPGGGVFVLSNAFEKSDSPDSEPPVRNVLENSLVQNGRIQGTPLVSGAFATMDLSFDAKKLAFAYVQCGGDREQRFHLDPARGHWHEDRSLHVFTVNLDGSDLRQLTDGTWNDFDPCFLPNDRIAFISERRNGYLRCGRECPTFTLFDMNPDGSRMRCLSYHETNEWNPSVTHDGRILYTRWDYVDRWGCIAHHPWITSLDGRDARAIHGNFVPRTSRPDMELGCRVIPDSNLMIATAAPHHGQAYGSIVIIDPRIDDLNDPMGPVKRVTPEVAFPESQGGAQVYGMPYPLSENLYLVVADFAMKNGEGSEGRPYLRGDYGIYLLDAFGNKELLYRDPNIGCASPMPLRARKTPPAPPQLMKNEDIVHQPYVQPLRGEYQPQATVSIIDVYQSLKAWPENTRITDLRVIQILPMSVPSGRPPHEVGFREPSSTDSVVLCRNVLGTVPVEKDGSAHFTVPAQKEILFQALDENGLAVQSMRSATYLKEGESLTCSGCHEPKNQTPLPRDGLPMAFKRAPSQIKPDVPEANPFSYPLLVQPVLEKHCVSCHAEEIAKGTENVPNLGKDPIERNWYASFNNLVPKYGFYDYRDPLRTTPGKFGAHASELYRILNEGHHDVALSPEEMHRITLWLDCVSPFYGVYEKEGGQAQLRGEVVLPTLE